MDWASILRRELSTRARRWGEEEGFEFYESLGQHPVVLFPPSTEGASHGNFGRRAWAAISADPDWHARICKPHSRRSALPPEWADGARELDSCNSSDALLMNCFCPSGASARLAQLMGSSRDDRPVFGQAGMVRLKDGRADRTEIDMLLGSVMVEAKLTERSFTTASPAVWRRYEHLEQEFVVELITDDDDYLLGYQLVRNVLAAAQHGRSLIVLIDHRRPDLLQEWWKVHGAIRDPMLRSQCGWRSWQEIAAASGAEDRDGLARKYGLLA